MDGSKLTPKVPHKPENQSPSNLNCDFYENDEISNGTERTPEVVPHPVFCKKFDGHEMALELASGADFWCKMTSAPR